MIVPSIFLSVDDIVTIHARVIKEFGGDIGLRDSGLLESAVAMPQSMFSGEYLHREISEMAAAYHYHLCSNHPFIDGNKRVALAASEVFLVANGFELKANDDELEKLTMGVASGTISKAEVVVFFAARICSPDRPDAAPGQDP
mgnify:CR=1 FL=1